MLASARLSLDSHNSALRGTAIRYNLQAQCDISVPILVVLLEHVRHPLETDARLHEQVKAHGILASTVVGTVQQCDELL